MTKNRTIEGYCAHCGWPVAYAGRAIWPQEDDRPMSEGAKGERCTDTACVIASVHRERIEERLGVPLHRGWILDGPGPARYGWASIHPSKERWEGYTLTEIAARLGLS